MKKISSRALARLFGVALLSGVLAGCTTNTYETYNPPPPPPPQPEVQYVPAPPPPPPAEPEYVPPPPAPVVVIDIHTDSDFYEPLGHYGRWVDVDGYGRCWTPDGVDHDWHPYTDGHWERTDDGWYWNSDEPWGWATCHYGRWFLDPNWGWVWVPQTEWAPAWVAWRDGDDYTGWAPLPPRARFDADGSLQRPDTDIDPHSFCFVEKRRMLEPQRPQTVIVNNITIVQKTVNVTKITVVNQTVINEGPSPDTVARASGHVVNVVPARTLRTKYEAPAIAKDHLRTITVQPHPAPQPVHNPRPNEPVRTQHGGQPVNPPAQPQQPRQPEQPRTFVPPNQPHPPQTQPPPRPVAPEQPANERNSHPGEVKQHEQNPNKPVNRPEPRPENNPPQNHPAPAQPRPEPNTPPRPPAQHENEPNRPGQPVVTPQQKQEQERQQEQQRQQEAQKQQEEQKRQELQKQQEQQRQQKAPVKPHPQEDKNHHSSTNAPPEHR